MSDVIVYPLAVLIHFENVVATFFTVMSPGWLPSRSTVFRAVLHFLMFTLKRSFHAWLDSSRICEGSPQKVAERQSHAAIEEAEIDDSSHSEWNPLNELLVKASCPVPKEDKDCICHVGAVTNEE